MPRGVKGSGRSSLRIVNRLAASQAEQLRVAILQHVNAQVAESWKGGGDPADVPLIEAEAQVAMLRLERLIDQLTED